jgi:hypothetical protein
VLPEVLVTRPRSKVLVAATSLSLAALVLAGCSGGDDGGAAGPTPTASTARPAGKDKVASNDDGAVEPKGGPLPKVEKNQVVSLVGKWVSNAPQKDYFVFKADGTASWMAQGRALWNGQVIPDGDKKFRFSWDGTDPREASYWGVTISDDGKTLTFGGTNQTYTKAKK